MRRTICWITSSIIIAAATAQEPSPATTSATPIYAPVGAPAPAKLPLAWNLFRDYNQSTQLLEDLAKAFPDRCRLESLGKSFGGKQMWVLTISDFRTGDYRTKPAFWIDGGIHANETQATDVVLYTAWFLAESFGKNPLIDRLLRERTFYLMPMMSPDSRDAHFHEPNTTHSPRSGQRPIDDDRDGLIDEDRPDDLDGDGHITQMRRKDPRGRFKPNPAFPNSLIPAEPDEVGSYTLLGSEGIDNDGDGKVNEDADGYYDPNRDWGWNWQPDYIQSGAYRYPLSILENRMVADFIQSHPNIAGAQSYHNTGGMILYGPGDTADSYPIDDTELMKTIGQRGEKVLPGYRLLNIGKGLYVVYGGEIDWLYAAQGILPFTNELFTPFNFFREPKGTSPFANAEDLHRFDQYLLLGDGFIPWHEVDHPQYGKIEVGGFKKNWGRQPPSFLLEEEAHRNMAFTLYHADQLPWVEVDSVAEQPLANGITQVTARISNTRLMPTHLAHDVDKKITPPDRVLIEGKGINVLGSFWSRTPIFDSPILSRIDLPQVRIPSIPGMGSVYVRWLVQGPGPYKVTVTSIKGGSASRSSLQQ
jgi:hypothetical protein